MKTISFNDMTYTCPHADLLRSLTVEERADLLDDVRRRGIVVPVVVDEDNAVIDGQNRLEIAAELRLGAEKVPTKVMTGLTSEQKRQLALDLNLHRRHLSRKEIREA